MKLQKTLEHLVDMAQRPNHPSYDMVMKGFYYQVGCEWMHTTVTEKELRAKYKVPIRFYLTPEQLLQRF